MATQREIQAERVALELQVEALLLQGWSPAEVATKLEIHVNKVTRIKRFKGLSLAESERVAKQAAEKSRTARLIDYCSSHLGPERVRALVGDDPVEVQRLHAALRFRVLGAESFLPVVERVLGERDRAQLAAVAESRGDARVVPLVSAGRGARRAVVRGAREERS